ncbi:thymidine phosphorylase [Acuticoccus sp.]|uniref:thymidine phosphorylase n=1 Tax=Acuticoccus sp. TaxID=1904378 RepID=UPI003B517B70
MVGPSGVGKDTLIDAARAALADAPFTFARRVVTRPREARGEDHEAMVVAQFLAAAERGEFAVTWAAHSLHYAVRWDALAPLRRGVNVVLNVSRTTISAFAQHAIRTVALHVTAPPEVVRERLSARGREDAAHVAARLARHVPLTDAATVAVIDNGTDVASGAQQLVAALVGAGRLPLVLRHAAMELLGEPLAIVHRDALALASRQVGRGTATEAVGVRAVRVRLAVTDDAGLVAPHEVRVSADAFDALGVAEGGEVTLRRVRPSATRHLLRTKAAGGELTPSEVGRVVRDLADGRYGAAEVAACVVAFQSLSVAEAAAFAAARADLVERVNWGGRTVVDVQSMGGQPGGPLAMTVVAIVAAHGLANPTTSPRVISSAAATVDAMGCVARVHLSATELVHVVDSSAGAVARSAGIAHDPFDAVTNALDRLAGVRSAPLEVSSVLARALAVGCTHVAVDIPVGPASQVATLVAARALSRLFEDVGHSVGLTVACAVSDGSRPSGRGIGPALELADARAVLAGSRDGSPLVREAALNLAGTILDWDPDVPSGSGRARAEELLGSGSAAAALHRIAAAQGPLPEVRVGAFQRMLVAPSAGRLVAIDWDALAGLSGMAGAPLDRGAGVRLLADLGDPVASGAPLATVFASTPFGLDLVVDDLTEGLFHIE